MYNIILKKIKVRGMNFKKIQKKLYQIIYDTRMHANAYVARNSVKKALKLGVDSYKGSDEEFEKVKKYWGKYHYKPKRYFYEFYGYLSQHFDEHIIPDDFFIEELMPYLDKKEFIDVLSNKAYTSLILQDIKRPKTILKCVNGFLVSDEDEIYNAETALARVSKFEKLVYKPSNDCQGNGVKIFNTKEDIEAISKIVANRQDDYIFQEFIVQSQQTSRFNPTSVNTLRVISLLIDDKVAILSAILRVGAKGCQIDNYHKGGWVIPIDEKGYLQDYKMSSEGFSKTDADGLPLVKEKLIGFDETIAIIKKVHVRFPHIRWIGWDFAIDEDNQPVFIELNALAWHNQRECGPSFGIYTDKVLEEYRAYKRSKNKG